MPRCRRRVPLVSIVLLLLVASSASAAAPDFTGSWQGALEVGAASLRLRFDVRQDDAGGLTGDMYSLDQGSQALPCGVTASGDTLRVEVAAIRGGFTGVRAADGESIEGVWSQGGRKLPLTVRRRDGAADAEGTRVDDQPHGGLMPGAWVGALQVGAIRLRLQMNVSESDGLLDVTMDSLDQGANGIPALIELDPERAVTFLVNSVGGRYAAVLDATGDTLTGKWTQGPQSLDLVMARVAEKVVVVRPQEPEPPYPYEVLDVTFPGGAADVTLAGTLTLPEGEGPFPGVVLVSGSGPQNRDEELMGHKPFLVLADALTRRGVAVLRYDDRGTASSTGQFKGATTADFADDAQAAAGYLMQRAEVDPAAVGIAGHSEGGLVAPMVAARMPELGFIVMLAGPGVDGRDILRLQTRLLSEAMGESPAAIDSASVVLEEMFVVMEEEQDQEAASQRMYETMAAAAAAAGEDDVTEEALRAEAEQMSSPWMRFFLFHDPAPDLRKVRCPVLAVNGGLDLQVDPGQNLPAIREALAAGRNDQVEIHELPGLNHLFQTAETGSVMEYATIEETMAPQLLQLVGDWILKTTERD